jgi:hypothetical protein
MPEADAGRRAGSDDVAGHERHELAHVAHDLGDVEDHGLGVAGLHALAVEVQPHRELLRVGHLVARHQPGAEGAEGVAALALVPGAAALDLVLALAHVVDDAIAGHVVERALLRDVARLGADHHAELHLPVALDRVLGQHDRIVRALDAAGGLHEDHRLGRDRQARLGRVVGIVEADGDELAHIGHRAAVARLALDQRQLVGLELAQLGERGIAQLLGADVLDLRAQVAQQTLVVDEAWLLLAWVAVANEFHVCLSC